MDGIKEAFRPAALRLWLEDDGITLPFDEYLIAFEAILFRQAHRLRTARAEQLGRLHVDTVAMAEDDHNDCLIQRPS